MVVLIRCRWRLRNFQKKHAQFNRDHFPLAAGNVGIEAEVVPVSCQRTSEEIVCALTTISESTSWSEICTRNHAEGGQRVGYSNGPPHHLLELTTTQDSLNHLMKILWGYWGKKRGTTPL